MSQSENKYPTIATNKESLNKFIPPCISIFTFLSEFFSFLHERNRLHYLNYYSIYNTPPLNLFFFFSLYNNIFSSSISFHFLLPSLLPCCFILPSIPSTSVLNHHYYIYMMCPCYTLFVGKVKVHHIPTINKKHNKNSSLKNIFNIRISLDDYFLFFFESRRKGFFLSLFLCFFVSFFLSFFRLFLSFFLSTLSFFLQLVLFDV